MFKRNGGFTLVELIVVIAVLAILAGIAVPAYSGYMRNAAKAGDITTLSAIRTAVFASLPAIQDELDTITVECADKDGVVTRITAKTADFIVDGEIAAGESYILFAADGTLDEGEALDGAAVDFKLYAAAVADLRRYPEGAVWTAADGWAG